MAAFEAFRRQRLDAQVCPACRANQFSALDGDFDHLGCVGGNDRENWSLLRGRSAFYPVPSVAGKPTAGNLPDGPHSPAAVINHETGNPACRDVGVRLGRPAFANGPGLGADRDLAVFRLLMLLSPLETPILLGGHIGHILDPPDPESCARNRLPLHPIAAGRQSPHVLLNSSSSSGRSLRMAFPRCEMAFFSSLISCATVLLRWGTRRIGS